MTTPPSRRHLAYFVRVAEEGQISGAARALYIAQPALSQAMARLERQLGVTLLERHARGVTLTSAGEILFEKAKATVQAEADVATTARSLARTHRRTVVLGFLGSPPSLLAPQLLSAFAGACPEIEVSFRELRFPTRSAAEWLAGVDLALCHSSPELRGVGVRTLRREPRCVLLLDTHPLASRTEIEVLEVIDEPFYGRHPSVDPTWVAFWNLNDHRDGPPSHVTNHAPANYLELVAAMASGVAITTMPKAVAEVTAAMTPHLVARPLRDAAHSPCELLWRKEPFNPLITTLLDAARQSTPLDGEPNPPVRDSPSAGNGVRGAAAVS